ncbi:MAG: spore coat protein [Eubacteriales bacterium]
MLEEKDRLTDSLITQKYLANCYNSAAAESANTQLMDTFIGILRDEHHIQHEIFGEMANRGWYQPKVANMSDVSQNLNKWNQELQRVHSIAYRQAGAGQAFHQAPYQVQAGYQQQFGQQQTTGIPQQNMFRPPQNPVI